MKIKDLMGDSVFEVKYGIEEIDNLRFSHDYWGRPRDGYIPFLQPREACHYLRQDYLRNVARFFDARQLVAEFYRVKEGTPILVPIWFNGAKNWYVGVGNGRCAILEEFYKGDSHWHRQREDYRQCLEERTSELGLSLKGYQKPVLIRYLMSGVDVKDFVQWANTRDNQGYSKDEQSVADAALLNQNLLVGMIYLSSTEKSLLSEIEPNQRFVSDFLGKLPHSERAALLDDDAVIDLAGIVRLERALLSYVYGESWLNRLSYDSYESNMRHITNGIRWSVLRVAQAETLIKNGQRNGLSIAKAVIRAVELWQVFKSLDMSIGMFLSQKGLFDAISDLERLILRDIFAKNNRSGKKIKSSLEALADYTIALPAQNQNKFWR